MGKAAIQRLGCVIGTGKALVYQGRRNISVANDQFSPSAAFDNSGFTKKMFIAVRGEKMCYSMILEYRRTVQGLTDQTTDWSVGRLKGNVGYGIGYGGVRRV